MERHEWELKVWPSVRGIGYGYEFRTNNGYSVTGYDDTLQGAVDEMTKILKDYSKRRGKC